MMKKILSVLACIFMVINLVAEIDSKTWQKITMLEKIARYDLAREIISTQIRVDLCKTDVEKLISMNDKLLEALKPEPVPNTVLEKIYTHNKESWADFHIKLTAWHFCYRENNYPESLKDELKKVTKNFPKENPFPGMSWGFIDKEDILKQLDIYDILKKSVINAQFFVRQKILNNSTEQISELSSLLENLEKQKNIIKIYRTIYLSDIAVYPYIRASNEIVEVLYMTKDSYALVGPFAWGNVSETMLNEIGRLLSLASYREWLFQCDQTNRELFFNTISRIKKVVPTEQFQAFKAKFTLLDSNDPSKARGADAWWK